MMSDSPLPILYSFRRCPYAMRARLALMTAGIACELREVKLANKPAQLLETSAKATVPVLVLPDERVLEESIDIMRWALGQNDPEGWLVGDDAILIECNDGPFKSHLDRYKYPTRYLHEIGPDPVDDAAINSFRTQHQSAGRVILSDLNVRLSQHDQLSGSKRTIADMAIFPFVRQFANSDRAWFDVQNLPHLQRWLAGHLASDIFAAIMPKYTPWAEGDDAILFAE